MRDKRDGGKIRSLESYVQFSLGFVKKEKEKISCALESRTELCKKQTELKQNSPERKKDSLNYKTRLLQLDKVSTSWKEGSERRRG